jgi:hypothetical protein
MAVLDVLGIRRYVVCGGDVLATWTYPSQIDLGVFVDAKRPLTGDQPKQHQRT